MANNNAEQQLLHNQGNGSLEDVALLSGTAYDEKADDFRDW